MDAVKNVCAGSARQILSTSVRYLLVRGCQSDTICPRQIRTGLRLEVSPGRYYLPPSGTFRQILSVPISSPLSATFRPSATSARQLPALRASATSARQQPPSPAIRHPISSVLPAALRPSATSARQLYPPPRISNPHPHPSATSAHQLPALRTSATFTRQVPLPVSYPTSYPLQRPGVVASDRQILSIYLSLPAPASARVGPSARQQPPPVRYPLWWGWGLPLFSLSIYLSILYLCVYPV